MAAPTLHLHPLASYCWKVLIALYENETAFVPNIVNLGDPGERAALKTLWPIGKFPVLVDGANVVAESSCIIDYLADVYPGKTALIPAAAQAAREARLYDRFFDLYVHEPMQKVVGDRLRPEGAKDPYGVEQAKATLDTAYTVLDLRFMTNAWAAGEAFSVADCAAAPALYYANLVHPYDDAYPNLVSYTRRLLERPSFRRVLKEAEPYFDMFPR